MKYPRPHLLLCSMVIATLSCGEAFAYKQTVPSDFASKGFSDTLAFRYDDSEKKTDFFRIETAADALSVNGSCYDMALTKEFSIDMASPTASLTVYDKVGCIGEILEQGILSCGGSVTTNAVADTSSDTPSDIVIDMSKGTGTGWAMEARGSREALRYSGAASGECDMSAGYDYTFTVPETREYTLRTIITGSCNNLADCVDDDGRLTVKPSGVCISLDNNTPTTAETNSLAELWLFTSIETVTLSAGEHTLSVYGSYSGSAVNSIILSPSENGTLLTSATSQALVGCNFIDASSLIAQ